MNFILWYNSNTNRFTYHLFDDSLADSNPFDFNKIDDITFSTNFKLTKEKKSHKVLILLILLESYFDVTTEWEWGEALKPL